MTTQRGFKVTVVAAVTGVDLSSRTFADLEVAHLYARLMRARGYGTQVEEVR